RLQIVRFWVSTCASIPLLPKKIHKLAQDDGFHLPLGKTYGEGRLLTHLDEQIKILRLQIARFWVSTCASIPLLPKKIHKLAQDDGFSPAFG
ncbi:MAG: hypothetical protein PHS82_13050, partial [Lachnospiraceae bacterium]|nr:hypothetical protein [Lachnospiraceae bacterium]